MSYNEIRLWVENDYELYCWWKSSKICQSKFIKENRDELTKIITKKLKGKNG